MFNTDSYAAKYDATAQRALGDEHVVAAVQVSRTGGWLTFGLSAVSGIGMLASMAHSKKKAASLPQMFFIAVTDERVVALGSGRGVSPKATKVLRSWPRAEVSATTAGVLAGTKLTLTTPDGTVECQGPQGEPTERVAGALALEAVAA